MYSKTTVTVKVLNPVRFERYFLDYTLGQANVSPDTYASLLTAAAPSLPSVVVSQHLLEEFSARIDFGKNAPNVTPPAEDPCQAAQTLGPSFNSNTATNDAVQSLSDDYKTCFRTLYKDALAAYSALEPYINVYSIGPAGPVAPPPADDAAKQAIATFLALEVPVSNSITHIGSAIPPVTPPPAGPPPPAALLELTDVQKLLDAIAADLFGYQQRLKDAPQTTPGARCTQQDGRVFDCIIVLTASTDRPAQAGNMVTRSVTYALNTLNIVANSQDAAFNPASKKSIATVALVYADHPDAKAKYSSLRWEASAGVLISTLPIRSFSVAPTYSGTAVTGNTVAENKSYPTVVPFAAANYRLKDDLGISDWRSSLYWTPFAVGVNPNTKLADFGTGFSLSWREVMLSAFCHFAHDVELTQGFYKGEALPAAFTQALPTRQHWVEAFAIGLSVRVPSLTGR